MALAPDFTGWQKLLDDFLLVISPPGAPLETRFDYFRLYANARVAARLAEVRHALLAVAPGRLTVTERHAWAINTYNFLVIEQATQNLVSRHVSTELRSRAIFGLPYGSVRDMRINGASFFEAPVAQIEGHTYSLDAFERRFVFDGYEKAAAGTQGKPAPKSLDPRAHFALVCGAVGCPPLRPRAFLAESLDVQLDRACRDALANPRHLRWDPALRRLAASAVMNWYSADFGGPDQAYEFIERYAPDSLRAQLKNKPLRVIDMSTGWDWRLNALRGPLPVPDNSPHTP